MGPFTLIGACLFFATAANCQSWNEPYYDDAGTKGITLGDLNGRWIELDMEEEILPPFRLIVINYSGSMSVTVDSADKSVANVTLEKEGSRTVVKINNRQDYENPSQRVYHLRVAAGGDEGVIIVSLINLFDNKPTVEYEGTCEAEELRSNYNTNCMYVVEDVDGLTNNRIDMTVSSEQNANKYFEFRAIEKMTEYKIRFALFIIQELHYEERAFFNFETTVSDIVGNKRTFKTMVEVIDMPNMDPIWVKPFATATFPEKTRQEFEVHAIDGDTGINKKIFYRVEFDTDADYGSFIRMERETGKLQISPINRDALQKETFAFKIFAYKYDNYSWAIDSSAMIVVEDINDNYPVISIAPQTVEFPEATYLTVPFETFRVSDIDLGDNASYNISLLAQEDASYADAFNIVPSAGYQNSTFTMTVKNSTLLDYEDPMWRSFQLMIISQETKDSSHYDTKVFNVKLINWNDEVPIFDDNEYTVSVNETVGKGVAIALVRAEDRDVGDQVRHKLVGSVRDLEIDAKSGVIKTSAKDAFDYERQVTVVVQVEASDNLRTYPGEPLHTTFAQLTVNVIDVNDETPEIRMPRIAPSIKENSPGGTIVTDEIQGKDPDTKANMVFEILWDETYATKSGTEADKETYKDCFIIQKQTIGGSKNVVSGILKVNPAFRGEIDYEKYEVIYLAIKLTDKNQEVNDGSTTGTLTIRIEDENDNAPQFVAGTLTQPRSVVEEAPIDTMIGTIAAIDLDGPPFNDVSYFIQPTNEKTPLWMKIDEKTGVIRVKDDEVIDCDNPIIYDLEYDVSATDGKFITTEMIKIRIIDTNNKIPQIISEFYEPIKKYENITTGEIITTIEATDIDRDSPYNKTSYSINYVSFPDLNNYFVIDEITGEVIVYLKGTVFDRDDGQEYHTVHVDVEDNYQGNGRKNQNSTQFVLQLLDVNDNAPKMPNADDLNLVASEALQKNMKIGQVFIAYDKDDNKTPNAQVEYEILKIEPIGENSEKLAEGSYNQLFTLKTVVRYFSTQIYTGQDLRGFYGNWNITIRAYDLGDMWDSRISLKSEAAYTVRIQPYNFNTPKIVYPKRGSTLRLKLEGQQIGKPLIMADDSMLQSFEAEDDDGGKYGNITFEIDNYGTNDDASYFDIIWESRTKSRLQLAKEIGSRSYNITLRATDSEKEDTIEILTILFVDLQGDPYFEHEDMQTDFTEHWFNETRKVIEAIDPKNEGFENEDDRFKVYYYIDSDFNPEDAEHFELDKLSRELRVIKEIDREVKDFYRIKVITTNSEVKPMGSLPKNSAIYVNITINDINDNPPKFQYKTYSGGITTNDYTNKQILQVHANDPDLLDTITYNMNMDDVEAHGSNIDAIKKIVFTLNKNTGVLYLAKTLISEMNGYFSFPIKAYDAVGHEDTCNAKVYIVSESNKVQYSFSNDYQALINDSDFVRITLQEIYEYESCNIDDIAQADPRADDQSNDVGSLIQTVVTVHFINNSEAVKASDIEERYNDVKLVRTLKTTFREHSLFLEQVPQKKDEPSKTMENLLVIILGVVTGVLAVLCVVLVVAFVMKTRRLNKQIEAFSPPDFGSTSSNLNRIGVPTSNIFSVEGSNPVLNNNQLQKDVFDTQSIDSDESDFAGINTDPNFIMEPSERRISELSGSTDNTDYTYKNSILSVNQFHDDNFGREKF